MTSLSKLCGQLDKICAKVLGYHVDVEDVANVGLEYILNNKDKILDCDAKIQRLLDILEGKKPRNEEKDALDRMHDILNVIGQLYKTESNRGFLYQKRDHIGNFVSRTIESAIVNGYAPRNIRLDLYGFIPIFKDYSWNYLFDMRSSSWAEGYTVEVYNAGPQSLERANLPYYLILDIHSANGKICGGVRQARVKAHCDYISSNVLPPWRVSPLPDGRKEVFWDERLSASLKDARTYVTATTALLSLGFSVASLVDLFAGAMVGLVLAPFTLTSVAYYSRLSNNIERLWR